MEKTTEETTIQLPTGQVIELVYVQGGEFMMGDDKSQYEDEKPCHPISTQSSEKQYYKET